MVLTPELEANGHEVQESTTNNTNHDVSEDVSKEVTLIVGGSEDEAIVAATNYLNADLPSSSNRTGTTGIGSKSSRPHTYYEQKSQ